MDPKTIIKLNNIPHGFYETEMTKFFSQFGKVKNVRLVRSPKTHKSRGFGFVEFELPQVAKIVAEAMHNYMFFNHVLKCRQMSSKDLPKNIFKVNYKGANAVEKHKAQHNVKQRSIENVKAHHKKILSTQLFLKKFQVDLQCHIINAVVH